MKRGYRYSTMTSDKKVTVTSLSELGNLLNSAEGSTAGQAIPQSGKHEGGIQARLDAENRAFVQKQMNELREREEHVANLQAHMEREKAQLEAQKDRLTETQQKLDDRVASLQAARERLREKEQRFADLQKAEGALASKEKALEKREGKQSKLEASAKKARDTARGLRSELKAQMAESQGQSKKLRSAERRLAKLQRELARHESVQAAADSVRSVFDWMLENAVDSYDAPWEDVVVVGSGPVDEVDFWNFLIDRGMQVYEPNSEGVRVMIVGRTGWAEDSLERQIAVQEDDELRVYSQEMALAVLCSGSDILEEADEKTLLKLADGHPALQFLRDTDLQWPLKAVSALPDEFTPFGEESRGVDVSPIKSLGYTVGKTNGLADDQRKRLLERAFTGQLPRVHSDEYMKEWGRPGTRRRLWRMAHHLAWLARSWRNVPSHAYAVDDWTRDLRMLEKQYFRPWMRFTWPQVAVPGTKGLVRRKKVAKKKRARRK